MQLGFNHNVRYRGDIFHVQTEESGRSNPVITTLLYRGGVIIAARKTNYGDIIKFEELERLVLELMQEQHKAMLRSLKNGELDYRAFPDDASAGTAAVPGTLPGDSPHPDKKEQSQRSLDDILIDYLASQEKG